MFFHCSDLQKQFTLIKECQEHPFYKDNGDSEDDCVERVTRKITEPLEEGFVGVGPLYELS